MIKHDSFPASASPGLTKDTYKHFSVETRRDHYGAEGEKDCNLCLGSSNTKRPKQMARMHREKLYLKNEKNNLI